MFYDNLFYMVEFSACCRFSAQATALQFRIRKVMASCVKIEQLDNAYKWGLNVVANLYNDAASHLLGNPLEQNYICILECIKETYCRVLVEIECNEAYNKARAETDRLRQHEPRMYIDVAGKP